tara:strand:- start:5311 stop:6588 length:1278 start_codon:yes stop_codon:yes gene_type:complete
MVDSRIVLRGLPLVALGLLAIAIPSAHAEERLSSAEFRARIQGTLPELESFAADVLSAKAKVADAQTRPAVSLSYEREEVFTGNDGVALKNAVALGWSLDISGRRGRHIKSAKLGVDAAKQTSELSKTFVTIRAMEVYYLAAQARLKAESLTATRIPLATLVDSLRNRVNEGDASGYDLARFELELAEHDDALAAATTERVVAEAELAALLGASDSRVVAASELPLPSLSEGSENLAGSVHRGDVLAAQHEERGGELLKKAASRWWVPVLDLSIGYLNTDFGPGGGPGANFAHGYTGMISASIPVFSKGEADRKRGEAQVRRAKAKRKILERRIGSEIGSARTRLAARVQQTLQFQERQLVRAADLAVKTKAAYQGGEASALELRDAYNKASSAQLRFIDLRYQCQLAELALWKATGTLGAGVNQ